ncbi:hypothetical protein N9W00_00635 [Arcobacteraceae bacterium]|nr:hypothetical protein [Arcobacteraceae bacterium]
MQQLKINPKIILLKGNGPITINSEMMELFTITTSHGMIGLPLKSLRADNVYIVDNLASFWEIEKTIKEKPCCFVYSYEKLNDEDLSKIISTTLTKIN